MRSDKPGPGQAPADAQDGALLRRLGLGDFVALDLETTGLDPQQHEIIEFGAVRFTDGRPHAGVSQLLRPAEGEALPAHIVELTGITDEDLRFAPEPQDALPDLLARWVGTGLPVVAYNADFELAFLKAAARRWGLDPPPAGDFLDALLLARTFLPTLYNHKLETLIQRLGIETVRLHRARDDAEAVGRVLLHLAQAAARYDAHVLGLLAGLAPPGRTRALLHALEEVASLRQGRDRDQEVCSEDSYADLPGLRGPGPELEPNLGLGLSTVPPVPLDPQAVRDLFRPEGRLAQALEGFEERREQQEMAQATGEAFNEGRFLVAEAGTGVGKSFAYLIPALKWASQNELPVGRVVLATKTKTLQDQLFHQDIPRVSRALGVPWRAVLLKGRQNYLCLRRLDARLKEAQSALPLRDGAALMPLVTWLTQTQTGDLEEVHGLWRPEVRRWVYDDPEYCVGRRCAFHERCFSVNARAAARGAQLVVVNHALLLADLTLEGNILGDYEHLIVDEAHHLERSAREALKRTVGYWSFKALFDELVRRDRDGRGTEEEGAGAGAGTGTGTGERERGLLVSLSRLASGSGSGTEASELVEALEEVAARVGALRGQGVELFRALTTIASHTPEGALREAALTYGLKRRYDPMTFADQAEALASFGEELEGLERALDALADRAESALGQPAEEAVDALRALRRHLGALREEFAYLCAAEAEGIVFWYELSPEPGSLLSLSAAPLDVGEPLLALYERLRMALFTSATLSVGGGDFSYFKGRIGLDRLPPDRVVSRDFGQPFDYARAVKLCLPTYLPDPNERAFPEALAELLFEVVDRTARRTLALFTSYKLLDEVYDRLRDRDRGLFLRAQGRDGPRRKLLEEFRRSPTPRALLLGADSFWEGVDLPGESLEILVLTKLPFPVPSDPQVEAEEERLRAQGRDAFWNYSLPQAVLSLRQGFGRLIRSRLDRGAVILTDPRVARKRYGQRFLQALPCPAQTYYTPSSLLLDLEKFFTQEDADAFQ